MKELEDKVGLLEQKSNDQEAENSALKQLLQQSVEFLPRGQRYFFGFDSILNISFYSLNRLKSENDRLKVFESAFSFSYDKDVNNSSTMPTSSTFDSPSSTTSSRPPAPLPTGSSSSNNNESSFSFDNSSFELPVSHSTDSTSLPSFSTEYPPTSSSLGAFPDNLFLNSLTVPPSSNSLSGDSPVSPQTNASTSSTSRSSSYITTPPPAPSDLFASYRDPLADLSLPSAPLATFGDLDQFFANTSSNSNSITSPGGGGGGVSSDPLSLAQFIKSPSPLDDVNLSEPPTTSNVKTEGDEKRRVTVTGQAGCPYGLVEGEKYEFDLDNLCAE